MKNLILVLALLLPNISLADYTCTIKQVVSVDQNEIKENQLVNDHFVGKSFVVKGSGEISGVINNKGYRNEILYSDGDFKMVSTWFDEGYPVVQVLEIDESTDGLNFRRYTSNVGSLMIGDCTTNI